MQLRYLTLEQLETLTEWDEATFTDDPSGNGCCSVEHFDDPSFQAYATEQFAAPLNTPTGNWADFNLAHAKWRFMKEFYFFCQELVGDEPRIEDYSNLDAT